MGGFGRMHESNGVYAACVCFMIVSGIAHVELTKWYKKVGDNVEEVRLAHDTPLRTPETCFKCNAALIVMSTVVQHPRRMLSWFHTLSFQRPSCACAADGRSL